MRILIVEDDKDLVASYKKDINQLRKIQGIDIIETVKYDKTGALKILLEQDFDAAIVDLNLANQGGSDTSGNEVIREIKKNLRFPIYVVTGTPHNIDHDISEESEMFKIITKGDQDEISYIEQLVNIYNTGVTKILSRKGLINEHLNKIFWSHLSKSLDLWIKDERRTPEEKEKSLLRYTLAHVQEYLEITDDSTFELFNPAEIYITPPIKTKTFTGDIFQSLKENELTVVLTPACDLAQSPDKDDDLILLVLVDSMSSNPLGEEINVLKNNKTGKNRIEKANNRIQTFIKNGKNQYHFLPPYKMIEGGLINFKALKAITRVELNNEYKKVATITSSFTKDITARFSYYYSRQGSPDFNIDEVKGRLLS